jgi:hypothetical protein
MFLILVALVLGAVVAGGNNYVTTQYDPGSDVAFYWLLGAPVVACFLVALLAPKLVGAPAPVDQPLEPDPAPPPPEPIENAALRLLATLQEEGRLIDFLSEDIGPYSDDQVGAATRGIHESCAKALRACVTLEPVLTGKEDEVVTVPAGFDPKQIRLTGNVHGEPPFKGTLRHAGWRATDVKLPARAGLEPRVIAPAEVEIA